METFKTIEYRGIVVTVSNYGNIKKADGSNRKLQKNSHGYACFVCQKKDGSHMLNLVHRIVATAFIPNPENKPQVNHKDGVKWNNHVDNLEWMTKSENEMHSTRVLGNKRNLDGFKKQWENSSCKLPVDLYTKDMVFIKSFPSLKECAEYIGVVISAVGNNLKGRTKTTKGHIVKYSQSL